MRKCLRNRKFGQLFSIAIAIIVIHMRFSEFPIDMHQRIGYRAGQWAKLCPSSFKQHVFMARM